MQENPSEEIDNYFQSQSKNKQVDTKYLRCLKTFSANEDLKNIFQYNQMTRRIEYKKAPQWNSEANVNDNMEDYDLIALKGFLSRNYGFTPNKEDIFDALKEVSRRNAYHPIKDYLNGLTWDGVKRLDYWLTSICGVEDNQYVRDVGRKIFVAMVNRIYEPGCQFDYLPVLEGIQGIRKSTLIKRIVGDEKYYGSVSFHLSEKAFIENMQGKWVLEVEEMSGQNKQEVERVRALISKTKDTMRMTWERVAEDYKRQSVMIGTRNPIKGDNKWLYDPAGNRRFWPVICNGAINIDLLLENRDMFFGEAMYLYKNNEPLWLDDKEVEEFATKEQELRQMDDPWEDIINSWLDEKAKLLVSHITVTQIAIECLKVPEERISRFVSSRIGRILSKTEWLKLKETTGKRKQYYIPPGIDPYDEKYKTIKLDDGEFVE